MSLDFKKLPVDGEDFEFLCRDLLQSEGHEILSHPSKGPDVKKDLFIRVKTNDNSGNVETNDYLVQCKHKAHSGKSVYESELARIFHEGINKNG